MTNYSEKNSLAVAAFFCNTASGRYGSGLSYYADKRVNIKSKAHQIYYFNVHGTRRYTTQIGWQTRDRANGVLDIECSCPDYQDNFVICKHLVASMYYLLDLKTEFNDWQQTVASMEINEPETRVVTQKDLTNESGGVRGAPSAYDDTSNQNDKPLAGSAARSSGDGFWAKPLHQPSDHWQVQKEKHERTLRLRRIQGDITKTFPKVSGNIGAGAGPSTSTIQVWYELQGRPPGDARWPAVRLRQRNVGGMTKTERRLRNLSLRPDETTVRSLPYDDGVDYDLVYDLAAANNSIFFTADSWNHVAKTDLFSLPRRRCADFLRKIIATKRGLFLPHQGTGTGGGREATELFEASENAWKPKFWLSPTQDHGLFEIKAAFYHGPRSVDIGSVAYMTQPGIAVLHTGEIIFFHECAPAIIVILLEISRGPIQGSAEDLKLIILNLMTKVPRGDLELEQSFAAYGDAPPVKPKISLLRSGEFDDGVHIPAVVAMTYGEKSFSPFDPNIGWAEVPAGSQARNDKTMVYHRDMLMEDHWLETTQEACGEIKFCEDGPPHFNAVIERERVVGVMLKAIELGWAVELQGKKVKAPKDIDIKVSSGIDWFDVKVTADLGDGPLGEDDLLRLLRGRQTFTTLADGSVVINTSQELQRNAAILERFANEDGTGTFRIPKLHALLLELEEERLGKAKLDGGIHGFLESVKKLQTPTAVKPGREFQGVLRPYQAQGLGWLKTLRDTKFGGCLADDMGLGKTIQVLAHLGEHYGTAGRPAKTKKTLMKPSLLVVPRSLVFNWQREAAKFAPGLRMGELNHETKAGLAGLIKKCDVIVATYAMTRTQLETLKDIDFEYVILDEAQAIKNASSQIARSVKVLKAEHRLALSGTPVENHLSDLTSIFEFINPGLCAAKGFQKSMTKLGETPEGRVMLGRLLKPFILRRTKTEVLKDLPAKTETIIYCDLSAEEQDFYNRLSESVRANLQAEIKAVGIAKAQIHILSALTRLRQAACDRRLIEAKKNLAVGTKIDLLLDRVKELSSEGQKTVVFSQFTQFLALAKQRLDDEKIPYCYLDGQTKDRQRVVDQFNCDHSVPVFFVSLKAGGVGLNLTSASHCFLLDPWWNPAAEAQAIDRLHRIGQQNPVFAYRLIGRGTVEEKILQLQDQKRGLADAVINGQGTENADEGRESEYTDAAPRSISMKDLQLLLG